MKTVQDYLELGLVFVDGDKICGVTSDPSSSELGIFDRTICSKQYSKGAAKIGVDCYARARWTPSSFAWRNNDGVKPDYKWLIEVYCESGNIHKGICSDFMYWWDDGTIIKWRPVVLQSVLPKEDKPMKPVYTAEMHARNELPPVDSKVKVCIDEAGFELEGNDHKYEGKVVTAKAAFVNKNSEKLVAIENDKGNCACYIIECIKPIIKAIKVNGFDVPAPISEAPERGSEYFVIDMHDEGLFCSIEWEGDDTDNQWLSKGIIHSTESAAIAHAKAMLGIDPNA